MDIAFLDSVERFAKTLVAENVESLSGDPITLTITIDKEARELDRKISQKTTRTFFDISDAQKGTTEIELKVDRVAYAIGMIPIVEDWSGVTSGGKAIPYDAGLLEDLFKFYSQPGELAYWFGSEVAGALKETKATLKKRKESAEKN
jgi:hypothetical protein